jgi:hypothetical protein
VEERHLVDAARWKSWLQSQDFLAAVALLAIGGFALYESAELTFGSLAKFGPGLLPRVLAGAVVVSGVFILIGSLLQDSDRIGEFRLRGPIFIGSALVVFAITIKPFGLIVAAPLVILVSAAADSQTRWHEAVALAALLTGASILVFGYLLTLSIPMFPSAQTVASLTSFFR